MTPINLTPNELEISKLISKEYKDKEIAAALFMCKRTVQANIIKIKNKLGVSSRVGIAVCVVKNNLDQ